MLIGNYHANLSIKRRVAVPKKFRDQLGKKLIIAKWYDKCLVVTSSERWEELLKRITGRINMVTAPVRDTDRFILGSAYELDPDEQGRVIVPGNLAAFAGLKNEVVFLGLGDRVEIWDKSEWEKRELLISQNAENMMEDLAKTKEVIS